MLFIFLSYITLYFITHNLCKNVYFSLVLTYFVFFSQICHEMMQSFWVRIATNGWSTLMRMIICVKNYHLFWFFSTYLYMILFYVSQHVVLSFYIYKFMQKGCNNLSTKKIYVYNFYLNIFRYITLYYIRRTVNDWYKNLYTQLFLITHICNFSSASKKK